MNRTNINTPNTVIMIASFPGRQNRSIAAIDAVASYTDHLTGALSRELARSGKKLVVLTQKTNHKTESYEEHGIQIIRCWDKGSPIAYLQILNTLRSFTAVRDIMVQFEFHQFGGNSTTLTFPVFLATLRLMQKRVQLVMHQVVTDITTLSGHVNIAPTGIRATLFNQALIWFYRLTTPLATRLVVHNEILKDRLYSLTKRRDIAVIPHGLGAIKQTYTREQARKQLGYKKSDNVVLMFGFLAWYKGTDWLVNEFAKHKQANMKLLVAGGVSPNLADKPHYQQFLAGINKTAESHTDCINITGFVEDRDIALYFAAADMVVLPYRTLMSSSGPLAMTISFQKPFILSRALEPYLKDTDFKSALHATGLTANDLIFSLESQSFWKTVTKALKNTDHHSDISSLLYETRKWETVSESFAAFARPLVSGKKFAIIDSGIPAVYAHT